MRKSDLRLKKYALMERLIHIEDEHVLDAIDNYLNRLTLNNCDRISIEQYNEEIDAALRGYEENGGISHEEVGKRLKIGKYARTPIK